MSAFDRHVCVARRRGCATAAGVALAILLSATAAFSQDTTKRPDPGAAPGKKVEAPAPPGARTPSPSRPQEKGKAPQEAAKAGDAAKPPKPKPTGPPLFRVNGFLTVGYQAFAATETFDAALGKTGGGVVGGGASLTHRSGLLFQVDISKFAADGERAFVYNGQVYKLGIPLRVETMPVEFSFGYKFFTRPPAPKKPAKPAAPPAPAKRDAWSSPLLLGQAKPTAPPPKPTSAGRAKPWGGVKPYAGAGFGIVSYKETGGFASSGDDVDDSFTSVHVVGGVEIPIWKRIGAAAEINYRWVKDALGEGGLSKEFGEDDLGGACFRVKVTIGM